MFYINNYLTSTLQTNCNHFVTVIGPSVFAIYLAGSSIFFKMIPSNIEEIIASVALKDDQCAFEKIYKAYYSRLFRLGVSIVKSEELANEIYDDVLLNVWQKRKQLTEVNNFTVYIYVAMKNASLRQLSKIAKTNHVEINDDFDIADPTPTAQEQMMSLELLGIINQAISELSPQCRQVFKLVKEDGLKYKEVAEILNVSIKNVEYHMGNALKKISYNVITVKNPVINNAFKTIIFN